MTHRVLGIRLRETLLNRLVRNFVWLHFHESLITSRVQLLLRRRPPRRLLKLLLLRRKLLLPALAEVTRIPVDSQSRSPLAVAHSLTVRYRSATFYYQNGVTGACGTVGQDSDLVRLPLLARPSSQRLTNRLQIAAMDSRLYQRTPDGRSALCDRQIRITRPDNGKSVTVRCKDECPTCISANSIG